MNLPTFRANVISEKNLEALSSAFPDETIFTREISKPSIHWKWSAEFYAITDDDGIIKNDLIFAIINKINLNYERDFLFIRKEISLNIRSGQLISFYLSSDEIERISSSGFSVGVQTFL